MSHPVKKNELLADIIQRAFTSSRYPGDARLVFDNSGGDLECTQVAHAFKGKQWSDLSVSFLRLYPDSLFFLSPEAYWFYLPAYLLASVLSYRCADIITINVVYSLTPPANKGSERDCFDAKIQGFSPEQRAAIKAFLEFLQCEHAGDFPFGDVEIALDRYWRSAG